MSLFTEQEIQEYEEKAARWIGALAAALIDVFVEFRKSGRRERIATAALQSLLAGNRPYVAHDAVPEAMRQTDLLIAELDSEQSKEPA